MRACNTRLVLVLLLVGRESGVRFVNQSQSRVTSGSHVRRKCKRRSHVQRKRKHSADPLKNSPWFHGPLDKEIAGSALKSFKKEGAFIVRNSSEGANKYSMSLFFNGKVRHLRMPRTNDKYVLGDNGKVQFTTIVELVDYYSQHKVDLKSGGSTTLTAACPVK